VVRVAWTEQVDDARVREALVQLGAEDVHVDGLRATFVLPHGDPRGRLARMLENEALPVPETFVFGEFSLQELYRALYGEEGV
jgi:hypothetical protein